MLSRMTERAACEVYFNPACSKCRSVRALLEERGTPATYVEYLSAPPSREELLRVMKLLGVSDPRAIMRTEEPEYASLGLAEADADALLDAMTRIPRLIQRPIVICGDRAVIARPPEMIAELL
jgi:arsenate reductase